MWSGFLYIFSPRLQKEVISVQRDHGQATIRSEFIGLQVHWDFGDPSAASFSICKKAQKKNKKREMNIIETFYLRLLLFCFSDLLILMGCLPCEKAQ